jgi:hypothetical protein
LAALVNATTLAPRNFASCTSADPTPPEAPVTTTVSPAATRGLASMCSAVDHEHGKEASSASVRDDSTGYTLRAGMAQNWAKPPSRSEPR